ncbi:polysaccharide lyase family 8 super-sandwich domain-containing protein [Paenibacillus sp. FSL H3-0469]|uniref:polysaccharide lyase family 8 super-sandwich domain-containing protein n=1 Tax=Paenibacillus sp. FSL H3-0469 TaxID=2954506 RepID=UPI003100D57E
MRKTISWVSLFVLIISLFGTMGNAVPRVMAADEFDTLRDKWKTVLTGGLSVDTGDPDLANQIALTVSAVQNDEGTGFWDTLQTGPDRTSCGCLWTDLTSTTVSAEIVYQYNRIRSMALAYQTVGSSDSSSPAYNPLYGNPALRDDIIGALDWMYTNRYNPGTTLYNNWYHWELSAPRGLFDAVVLMYDDLTAAQITNYMNAVNKFTPDPNRAPQNSAVATGANRVEKSWVVTLRGILLKDSAAVALGRDGLSDATTLPTSTNGMNNVFSYVSTGDGMHRDGSFIQHNKHPYFGNYGTTYIQYIVNLVYLLDGSSWEITDPESANLYQWVYATYEPAVYNGSLMSMLRGRTIAYSTADDHYYGFAAAQSILLLSSFAPESNADDYRSMVKEWITKDTYRSFISGGNSIFYINLAKELLNDPSIAARGERIGNIAFPESDRFIQLRPGFGFGLAMSSSRIARYESINGDNLHGWHMGDGMTYLYNQDLSQYDDNYWPTVDPYRLAGTTVDTGTLSNAAGQSAVTSMNWVGGASDGTYGLAGMQLNPYGGTLSGKKSWFMFDDEIVALGAGIKSTSGRTIETIVDNRKLNGTGSNAFEVNGTAQSPSLTQGQQTSTGVNWMHLAGNTASGSDVGYYFPEAPTLQTLRETRSGKWTDIHSSSLLTDTKTNHFQTIWFDHGTASGEAGYQYALLPNLSTAQTADYAADPDYTVLENSTEAQAVKENHLNLTAVNFWNSASKSVGGITSSGKASVLLKQSETEAEVSVSDPTQANTGSIQLEINRSASGVLSADPGITVTQLSPTIKLSVDVNGQKGGSLRVTFDLTPENPGNLAAPVISTLSGGKGQATLSWSPVSGASGYRIKYGNTPGVYSSTLDVGTATSGTVTGLLNGTKYYYAVAAYNAAGEGKPSEAVHLLSALPAADAYVRDGTYASTNYGTVNSLVIKNSSSGYTRTSYLQFDISAFSSPVAEAKLRLVPTYVGAASNVNAIAVATGGWTETGIVWNNKSAAGSVIDEWAGMAVGVPVEIDVTAQVNEAIPSGGSLSFMVYAPSNTGSNGDVIYGSKEQTLDSASPVLAIRQ